MLQPQLAVIITPPQCTVWAAVCPRRTEVVRQRRPCLAGVPIILLPLRLRKTRSGLRALSGKARSGARALPEGVLLHNALPSGPAAQKAMRENGASREANQAYNHLEDEHPSQTFNCSTANTFPHDLVVVWIDVGGAQDPLALRQESVGFTPDGLNIDVVHRRTDVAENGQLLVEAPVDVDNLVDILPCGMNMLDDRVVDFTSEVEPAGIVDGSMICAGRVPDVAQHIGVHVSAELAGHNAESELRCGKGGDEDHDNKEDDRGQSQAAINLEGHRARAEAGRDHGLEHYDGADKRHDQQRHKWEPKNNELVVLPDGLLHLL
mmetsp:Transcript_110417/g.235846  ORF Transcript_110417/g.235846 Transcript_110417/m.235846 type:complete len:321 (-) Transcript_110417:988-1950(-)